MQLTLKQVQKLKLSRELKASAPTFATLFRMAWRHYLVLTLVFLGVIAYFLVAGENSVAIFFGGMFIATFLRDIKWNNQFVRDWPLSNEITNWDRVDQLLTQVEKAAP